MNKMIRGLRLLRGGRGRALRLGVLAVLGVWAWVALLSGGGDTSPAQPHGKVSKSPSPQVAPPISAQHSTASHAPPDSRNHAPMRGDNGKNQKGKVGFSASEDVNPRYNIAAKKEVVDVELLPLKKEDFEDVPLGDAARDKKAEGKEDQEGPDAREDYDEDEDDEDEDEEEDQGKWGGRNKMANGDEGPVEDEDVQAAKDNVALEEQGEEEGEQHLKAMAKDLQAKQLLKQEYWKSPEGAKLWEKNRNLEEKRPFAFNDLEANVWKGEDDLMGLKGKVEDLRTNDLKEDAGAIEDDLKLRRRRVKEVCKKYNLGPLAKPGSRPSIKHPPTPNYDVFYFDRNDGLAWCPIYKAASTTWLYNFILLGGLSDSYVQNTKEQVSHVARKLWPPLEYTQADMALKMSLKFMIVRHPFERIVSAYRDKLENLNIGKEHGIEHFYQKYGRKIVAKYRQEGHGPPPADRYSQDKDNPALPPPKGIEPTFEEFVRYLINTDLVYYADDHWMPYYLHCTPCLVDYDVIAKFETLERDQRYIIQKRKLEKKIEVSWKHLTKGKKTAETVKKYFATITKEQLLKLYEKYRIDFELFNYSIDDYLFYVKPS